MSLKCDVAVVGGGPVGLASACILAALRPEIVVTVFEARIETTRHHALRIGSLAALISTLEAPSLKGRCQALIKGRCQALITQFEQWKGKSIPTTEIQEKLTACAHGLGVKVFKGGNYRVSSKKDLSKLIQETSAKIIIGADGAGSQVREAIGAKREYEYALGYLLDLKCKTKEVSPRSSVAKTMQLIQERGFDLETIGKTRADGLITVSLQKFIDEQTYTSLITAEIVDGRLIDRGTSKYPWDMQKLQMFVDSSDSRPKAKKIYDHLSQYLAEHYSSNTGFEVVESTISTFPLTIYRSSSTATLFEGSVVILAGDASSGLVLHRGVNKGLMEAAACARAIDQFLKRQPTSPITSLPQEFVDYQRTTRALFFKESRFAIIKFKVLKFGEFLISCLLIPFKALAWIFSSLKRVVSS